TVAMTGDGVNDLLALKEADCSISVGQGSDAARQTAQLVLLDSDFAVLKDVLLEGRRVVHNVTRSAGVFFIKTLYSVLLCAICLLTNTPFPFVPIQITLVDLIIEGYPSFFLSFLPDSRPVHPVSAGGDPASRTECHCHWCMLPVLSAIPRNGLIRTVR
ncbi:MAG: hypothetical protein ACLT29_08060, partial [Ruminococcus callidus]